MLELSGVLKDTQVARNLQRGALVQRAHSLERLAVLAATICFGCAANDEMPAHTDDAGMRTDATVPPSDGPMSGSPGTCDPCVSHGDCDLGAFCVQLAVGGHACVPGCNIDLPDCPRQFSCVFDATSGASSAVCLPIGGLCCFDQDGDQFGAGGGCRGPDCNDADEGVNAGALEVCNAMDDDCDGVADEPPNDCATDRCDRNEDGTYSAFTGGGMCEMGVCVGGPSTSCGLFTCEEGLAEGDACATTCAPGGTDDDRYCIAAAHCDHGGCAMDVPNGSMCAGDSDCASGYCDSGYCCDGGSCCGSVADCPAVATVRRCDDPARCQGSRSEMQCVAGRCQMVTGIPDDSACGRGFSPGGTDVSCACCPPSGPCCTGEIDQGPLVCTTPCPGTPCPTGTVCMMGVCVGGTPDTTRACGFM